MRCVKCDIGMTYSVNPYSAPVKAGCLEFTKLGQTYLSEWLRYIWYSNISEWIMELSILFKILLF